jgi:hypothetical protein
MIAIKEIKEIEKKIKKLRKLAEEIMIQGGEIEAVKRNTKRALASIAMLELNICVISDLKN